MKELTVLRVALLFCVLFLLYQAVQELRTETRIHNAVNECREYYQTRLKLYGWTREPLTFQDNLTGANEWKLDLK